MRKINVALATLLLLTACSPQKFFYYPNKVLYVDPDKVGLHPEPVRFPSANGKLLSAIYFKTDQKPKGTVVHFHGNYGNLTSHFPLALFFLKYGYDVLSFDYQGYGLSEGKPTSDRLIEDGLASIHYAQSHLRDPETGVVAFGQSLGGATAIVVAAREPLVRAVICESAYSTHRGIARDVLGRHWFTWPLYPIVPWLVNRSNDPLRHVDKISPRPILFLHGDADTIVPVRMTEELYAKARDPKSLWIVPKAGHLELRQKQGAAYEKTIVDFLGDVMTKRSTRG